MVAFQKSDLHAIPVIFVVYDIVGAQFIIQATADLKKIIPAKVVEVAVANDLFQ